MVSEMFEDVVLKVIRKEYFRYMNKITKALIDKQIYFQSQIYPMNQLC